MKRNLVRSAACAAGLLYLTAVTFADPTPAKVKLETEEQKLLYALGVVAAARLPHFDMTEDEVALVSAGLLDGLRGAEPRIDMQSVAAKIEPYVVERVKSATEKEKVAGKTFREEAAKAPGAVATDSGLVYRELEAGTGAAPGATDRVKIKYEGKLRTGSVFDFSEEPVEFALDGVVPCFSEGLQKMKVGGKSQLICPPELAYGDRGRPPRIAPGATLVFEVELLEVLPPETESDENAGEGSGS